MTEKNEMGSPDFFDEVQEKVEQEMFLDPGVAGAEDAVRLKQTSAPLKEQPVVDNDIDDIEDPDLFEGDLDDALFDEINAVQPGVAASDAFVASDQTARADEAVGAPAGIDLDPVLEDLTDLREDDLMLGELIDSEMIESREELVTSVEEARVATDSAPPEDAGRDVLDTRTLGDLYATQGLTGQAVVIYEKLAAASPGDRALLERLGELRLQAAGETVEPVLQADPVSSESPPEARRDPQMALVKRLEDWLDYIQAEKERRCSKSS